MNLLTTNRTISHQLAERRYKLMNMNERGMSMPNAQSNSEKATHDWSNHTVLVAEDEETNFVYLQTALQRTNITILRAKNGREAVEIAKVTPHLDIILMDIKMPEMNGLEATRSIRSFRKDLVIIAQTAFAMEEDQRNCAAVGCSDFLAKPIRYKVLLETLAKYLH